MAQSLQALFPGMKPQPKALNAFESAAREIAARASLKVLLWGPTDPANDVAKKRLELCEKLNRMGHQADLSEKTLSPSVLRASGLNLTVAELLEAQRYDYIVVFMDSPGSLAEVHDFAKEPGLARKMLICVDGAHRNGYSAHGALRIFEGNNGRLHWFDRPRDLTECHLSTCVLDQIAKVFEAKQWALVDREAN